MNKTHLFKTMNTGNWHMKLVLTAALLSMGGAAYAAPVTIDFDDTLPTYIGLETHQEDQYAGEPVLCTRRTAYRSRASFRH